ncbi:hypothetical protein Sste5346_007128 [Sporothrix stenoceras]|uniref:NWD NACHT-NTPase N-terminal domain-containing protein n=1 Tax=Sporothrix stenoceras TaxID=5173 RepID=A0ABR3YVH5_9PEZI
MAGSRKKLQSWWRGRNVGGQARPERPERPNAAPAALSARGNNDIQQDRSGDSVASLVNHQESPATQSLWDRAYDALAKKNTELVKDYEKLLAKEEQTTSSASRTEPPIQPVPPRDVTCGPDYPSRQAQLNAVIEQGLRRMEGTKPTYNIAGHEFVLTDQITQAANLLLWAKDWINNAVQASPQASIAWAGVCLILPLLTNPTTAAEASLDGFADVTTRMRYYVALEPLLRRLGQNAGVALMSEAEDHIIDLYQHILEFQICCVLRFYQSRIITYVHDMFSSKDWKQATLDIKAREATVNKDLSQINELATREELEALNKTSIDALRVMKGLLSVSTQQLAVSKQQLAVSTQQSDVLQEQLVLQQDAVRQKLSDEQKKCLQLFCLTRNDNDATYEWYKDRVEDRIQGTCQWFLQHNHFQRWLAQESGPLLVSADPGCGKSVLAKYLIDRELAQQAATILASYFGLYCVVELLLVNGADVEAKDLYGWTPLSLAAAGGYEAVTRLLLDKGADVEANSNIMTPLSLAAAGGYEAVVRLLLDKGADVEAKDHDGQTPLSLAADRGYEAVARLLLDKGADVEAKGENGWTPLSIAADRGYEAVARLLLDNGADVEAKDLYGWKPLSLAAAGGYEAVARLLLDKGADVEAKDLYGRTPLSLAVKGGYEAVVQLLLDKGAAIVRRLQRT